MRTVLIVEDEILVRLVLADGLSDAGFRVLEASNADEAIAVLAAKRGVDVLVTDVEYPGSMNGFQLAWTVRSDYPKTVVVMASGRTWPAPGSLPHGSHWLPKPYTVEALLAILEAALAPNPSGEATAGASIVAGQEVTDGMIAQPLPKKPTES